MNEFTKDELETMANWGDCYTDFGCGWTDKIHRPLINKLQSLIDNYCEHEKTECAGGWTYKCIICGMMFGDETQ